MSIKEFTSGPILGWALLIERLSNYAIRRRGMHLHFQHKPVPILRICTVFSLGHISVRS